ADLCSGGSCVVDAAMRADGVQHRVTPARIEARADAREVQRRAKELLANAAAFRRVIAGATGRVVEACRAKRLALVDELRRDDLAVAQFHAVAPEFLIDDRERIAFAGVLNEVDVPFEDARHVHDRSIRDAGRRAGLEEGAPNLAVAARDSYVDVSLDRVGGEAGLFARNR